MTYFKQAALCAKMGQILTRHSSGYCRLKMKMTKRFFLHNETWVQVEFSLDVLSINHSSGNKSQV